MDVPWWKLISSISLVRWARKEGVDLSTEENQIKALDELKKSLGSRDFEFLGGSMDSIYLDIDHTVVQELNDCKDLDIQTLLPKCHHYGWKGELRLLRSMLACRDDYGQGVVSWGLPRRNLLLKSVLDHYSIQDFDDDDTSCVDCSSQCIKIRSSCFRGVRGVRGSSLAPNIESAASVGATIALLALSEGEHDCSKNCTV